MPPKSVPDPVTESDLIAAGFVRIEGEQRRSLFGAASDSRVYALTVSDPRAITTIFAFVGMSRRELEEHAKECGITIKWKDGE